MKTYKHVFFDLDHTLWDFEKNSNETLTELHQTYQVHQYIPIHQFLETFHKVNNHLWHLHDTYQISSQQLRETRFQLVFKEFDVENKALADIFGTHYLSQASQKPHLLPQAKEVLDYLYPKYPLHIITNGFPDVQRVKMQSGGILGYFQEIVTSAEAGFKKPDIGIFSYLMQKLKAKPEECIMIGDNLETDILGAIRSGIDSVYYNPKQIGYTATSTYEITCLSELKQIL
jgi:putative hydrolase of the HAD superfamily